jgi:dihydropteroate synthase
VDRRLGGSIAAGVLGLMRGADVLRVHDVGATREAIEVAEAIFGSRPWRTDSAMAGLG